MLHTADDNSLIQLISSASRRLVVIAPALSRRVADAVVERWRAIGPDAVRITLDVDAEVYRLGYGDLDALTTLEQAGAALGTTLQRHPGVRIGVVISDETVLAWAPVPALVEAGPRDVHAPNAILIGAPTPELLATVGLSDAGALSQEVGLDKATRGDIDAVEKDLAASPPQSFDITRSVRVFNAAFQFVELTMLGTTMGRRTVQIPRHLLGFVDAALESKLKTLLTIVPADHALGGRHLQDKRRTLEHRCLKVIPGYGFVVQREKKSDLETEVEKIKAAAVEFKAKVEAELGAELAKRVDELVAMLLPRLLETPPAFWKLEEDPAARQASIERRLREDLAKAVGTPERYSGEMKVRMILKDVTYETLNTPAFVIAARRVFPEIKALHAEFDAAKAAKSAL